jgi:hypothetical protein
MVSVPFRLYGKGAERRLLLRARTLDLSTAGALLHGCCSLQVGQPVRLSVVRGTARNPLELDAEVVRIAEPNQRRRHHGVAIRFTNLSPLEETLLKSIIAQARA